MSDETTALGGLTLMAALATGQAWAAGTEAPGAEATVSLREWVTLGIAVLGAGLGLMNTWLAFSSRRLQVSLSPIEGLPLTGQGRLFGFEVVNRSGYPVTVSEIGFVSKGPGRKKAYLAIPRHAFTIAGFPASRLEPREAAKFYFRPFAAFPAGAVIGTAYVKLATGETVTGDSPALKRLRAEFAGS